MEATETETEDRGDGMRNESDIMSFELHSLLRFYLVWLSQTLDGAWRQHEIFLLAKILSRLNF